MSERLFTQTEVNHMLGEYEQQKKFLFGDYEVLRSENDYLRKTHDLILQFASTLSEMNTFLLKENQELRNREG